MSYPKENNRFSMNLNNLSLSVFKLCMKINFGKEFSALLIASYIFPKAGFPLGEMFVRSEFFVTNSPQIRRVISTCKANSKRVKNINKPKH